MANEIRLRANNVQGTISDNPLTIGATSINSQEFVDLPVVGALTHCIVILDPLETHGPAEIVRVISHVGSGTAITVVRGQEGTSARSHPAGTTWVHGPIVSDYNYTQRAALSTNRPTSPFEGELIYETDTDYYMGYSGSAWEHGLKLGAWTAYTPTNTNVTVGDGTQTAKYIRIGRTIHWNYILVFGSTTAFSGTVAIGLPVQSGLGTETNHGVVWMQDSSTGANNQNGSCFLVSGGTTVRPVYDGGGTGINATTPFTWSTGDRLTISGTYEAAS